MRLCSWLLLTTFIAAPALAETPPDRTNLLWSERYVVHSDQTWSETYESDWILNTPRAVTQFSHYSLAFWRGSQTLTVQEAWVTQPDGTRLDVPPANIFTRTSAAAQNAPMYVDSLVTTVEFPQPVPGSHIHVRWRLDQIRPSPEGFNVMDWANPSVPHKHSVFDFELPESLPLRVSARGGFAVTDTRGNGFRHVTATMDDMATTPNERGSVASEDFAPMVVATTLPDLKAYGAMLHQQAEGKDAVTPEIAALAATIRGSRTGVEAARAISNWVAGHIRCVAVYLNPNDGYVPHPAAEVLRNGFGDCKDHVVLMQALLTASGIRSEPAIVQWGNAYRAQALPVVNQFNHAMVYLPEYDIFTNPTSAFTGFGDLDVGLSGKTVVIASAEGGVGRTPDSKATDNRYVRDSQMQLLFDGSVTGQSHLTFTGEIAADTRRVLATVDSLPTLVENNLAQTPEGGRGLLRTTDPRDLETPLDLHADWSSPRAVSVQDGDMYFPIPIGFDMEQPAALRRLLTDSPVRHTPMVFGARDITWSTDLTVPDKMEVKRMPPNCSIDNAAGSFVAQYSRTATGLGVRRHLTLTKAIVPPEAYADFQDLIYAAAEDARGVVVLTPRGPGTTTGAL